MATNRHLSWPELRVFAFDHRSQMEALAGATPKKMASLKNWCLQATQVVADGKAGYGFLCDSRLGQNALFRSADTGLWTGRPVECARLGARAGT